MSQRDPKGYYAALGVQPNASVAEIRAAYRRRAKDYHPDAQTPNASAARFREIAEAYETLNDARRRAAYDNSGARPSGTERTNVDPIVCSRCSKVAVQPRYVVFWTVVSALLVTWRNPTQGIFCSACARGAAWQASLVSAVAGWWGFPWGPLYTFPAIIQNALGGDRQKQVEDDLLWQNAVAFALSGQLELAYALARDVRNSRDQQLALKALRLMDVLEKEGVSQSTPKLKNAWRIQPITTILQAGLAFVVPAVFVLLVSSPSNNYPSYSELPYAEAERPYAAAPPYAPAPSPAYADNSPAPEFIAAPVSISTGEIRFVGSAPRLAPLEIVTRPGSNYYLKMVNLASGEAELIAFIRGGDPFEILMPLGAYEMRYAAGETWYGESLLFGPSTSYSRADTRFYFRDEGYQYAGYTVELVLQVDGNLSVDHIAPSEF